MGRLDIVCCVAFLLLSNAFIHSVSFSRRSWLMAFFVFHLSSKIFSFFWATCAVRLLKNVHSYCFNAGICFFFHCYQSHYAQVYLVCYCSPKILWKIEVFVGRFIYMCFSTDVLWIRSREMSFAQRVTDDIRMKVRAGAASFRFGTKPRSILNATQYTVTSLLASLEGFWDPADDGSLNKNEIVVEHDHCYHPTGKSREHLRSFALHCIQEFFAHHDLVILYPIWSVQLPKKHSLVSLATTGVDEDSFAENKTYYETIKERLEVSF